MNIKMNRGQTSLEYMIIITVLLVALLPIVYIANQLSTTSAVTSEARVAVKTIVETADFVTSLSPGSKISADIFIPQGYVSNESSINGKRVRLVFYLPNGLNSSFYDVSKANLTGTLPTNWGYHKFSFTLQTDASVLIEAAA